MTYRPADPRTGELLPPVRPGVTVYSMSRRYATGGADFPVGGIVIDTSHTDQDGTVWYPFASLHHGRVEYDRIAADDIDGDSYSGQIAVRPCRDLAARMNAEDAHNRRTDHLRALLALSNAIETRGVPVR